MWSSPQYEIILVLFITFACTICYLHTCFVSWLMISVSYFYAGAVKDFNLSLHEIEDNSDITEDMNIHTVRYERLAQAVKDHNRILV